MPERKFRHFFCLLHRQRGREEPSQGVDKTAGQQEPGGKRPENPLFDSQCRFDGIEQIGLIGQAYHVGRMRAISRNAQLRPGVPL